MLYFSHLYMKYVLEVCRAIIYGDGINSEHPFRTTPHSVQYHITIQSTYVECAPFPIARNEKM